MASDSGATVLVVDDDENQRWMVKTYLQKHGFTVLTADGGGAMREQIAQQRVDVVLLDVTMPGEDGFTLARFLREHHSVGIIMLTASTELLDRVLGLEIGADDYVTKPFEPRELMARIKALLRRMADNSPRLSAGSEETAELPLGDFKIDVKARALLDKNGDSVELTSMEFDLLRVFSENPGRVFTRDNLLELANKDENSSFDRSIDSRIGRIRKKIEIDPSKPAIIKTVRGVGYVYPGNKPVT